MAMRIRKQIKVLKEAKKILFSRRVGGLCFCICVALFKYNYWNDNDEYIPSFNEEHVEELCAKNDLPFNHGCAYWWDRNDVQIRAKVLDLLIEELESKTLWYKIKKLL